MIFLRFLLFGTVCTWWSQDTFGRGRSLWPLLLTSITAILLEGSQLFVLSRMPSLQDVLTQVGGCSVGVLFARRIKPDQAPGCWLTVWIIAMIVAVAVEQLHPFQLASNYTGYNWLPFWAHYQRTNSLAVDDFIAGFLCYFPLGFMLRYICRYDYRCLLLAIIVAVAISLPFELLQGWIVRRYPDSTDILSAVCGAGFGVWTCGSGRRLLEDFIADHPLVQHHP